MTPEPPLLTGGRVEQILGFLLAWMVLGHAYEFFCGSLHREKIYERTAKDVKFNKL